MTMAKKKEAASKPVPKAARRPDASVGTSKPAARAGSGRGLIVDLRYMTDFLVNLLKIPSPTGYTEDAVGCVREVMADLKLDTRLNNKGALVASWKGKASNRPRALTAHVDTLGAMVKEIDATGRLSLTRIGGGLGGAVSSCSTRASRSPTRASSARDTWTTRPALPASSARSRRCSTRASS